MDWISDPTAWTGLITLTLLELVLGIDNVVFLSIVVGKLPPERRPTARRLGLVLAVLGRVGLLLSLGAMMRLTRPLLMLAGHPGDAKNPWSLSGRDLILLFGGLFLIAKAAHEIHAKVEGRASVPPAPGGGGRKGPTFGSVLVQVMALDIVFSLDSVITALGMVDQVGVMIAAVLLSTALMLLLAGGIGAFVERHPTVKVLALAFLVLIGVNLVSDAFGQHLPRGYTYAAMAFAFAVELINLRVRRNEQREGPTSTSTADR
jgi:predicted tellurium resistance membrane protein TerC